MENDATDSIVKQRLYPEWYPEFPGEPYAECFDIIEDEKTGQGIIAKCNFEVGEVVFRFTGLIIDYQTLYTLQLSPGSYVHDPFIMGKVLHSCNPNMYCNMETRTFVCIIPIKEGDYVTMDYEQTEDELFREFDCCCGASNCRSKIRGKSKK